MALEDKTVPYEILIRFDVAGNLAGAHYQERRIVKLDGETLKNDPGPAMPLGLAPDSVHTLLADVLGEALAPALKSASVEMAARQVAEQSRDAARAEADELARQLDVERERVRILTASRQA